MKCAHARMAASVSKASMWVSYLLSPCPACISRLVLRCRFGAYDLHDLVVLDHHTVGVIVEIAKEACKVCYSCRRSISMRCWCSNLCWSHGEAQPLVK